MRFSLQGGAGSRLRPRPAPLQSSMHATVRWKLGSSAPTRLLGLGAAGPRQRNRCRPSGVTAILGGQDGNSSEAGSSERTGMISTNSFDFYEAETPRGGGGGLGGLARRASAWTANLVGRLLYQVLPAFTLLRVPPLSILQASDAAPSSALYCCRLTACMVDGGLGPQAAWPEPHPKHTTTPTLPSRLPTTPSSPQYYNWRTSTVSDLQLFLLLNAGLFVLAGAIEGAILRGIEEGSAAAAAAAGGAGGPELEAQAEDAWLSLYAVFKTVFGQDMPDLGSSFVHQASALALAGQSPAGGRGPRPA